MQEMADAVKDFVDRARCGQVCVDVGQQVCPERTVGGAVQIQRRHRRRLPARSRFRRRIGIGEVRVERRSVGSDDVGDVVGVDMSA